MLIRKSPSHQARISLQRKNSSRLFNQCHAIMYWKTVLKAKTVFFQSIERLQKCFLFTDDPEKEKDVLSSTSGYKISIGFLGVMIFLLLVLSTILIYKLHFKRKVPASSSRSSALLWTKAVMAAQMETRNTEHSSVWFRKRPTTSTRFELWLAISALRMTKIGWQFSDDPIASFQGVSKWFC